jgi:hypothetical protein
VRPLGVFAVWRLQAYGYTVAAVYAAYFLYSGWLGLWLVNSKGVARYQDFTTAFVAGLLALHGNTASIFVPAEFINAQNALLGVANASHGTWPYPPTYFLILAPLAQLPYVAAFLIWELLTLLGLVAVVYLIVRRSAAIAVVLASPFTAVNFLFGQSGFLTASLAGAGLLALKDRPALAGMFIGCLTYKPQFGILFPVALVVANEWRAFSSAAITTVGLAGASIAAFGTGPWLSLHRELIAQAHKNLVADSDFWGMIQTVYGLARYLNAGPSLAWLSQIVGTSGILIIVCLVWRSGARYALKAATLSAGMLIATPYAFPYDMAAMVVPAAFLVQDQIRWGASKAEQVTVLAAFVTSFSIIATGNTAPVGALIMLALLAVIVQRVLRARPQVSSSRD